MRYLKLTLLIVLGAWLAFELAVNLEALKAPFTIAVGFPWVPIGTIIMPAWLALAAAFAAAFIIAIALELGAWYEYTRLIRLQRKQILGLQDALENPKPSP